MFFANDSIGIILYSNMKKIYPRKIDCSLFFIIRNCKKNLSIELHILLSNNCSINFIKSCYNDLANGI